MSTFSNPYQTPKGPTGDGEFLQVLLLRKLSICQVRSVACCFVEILTLRIVEGPSYVLKSFPENYAMYDHHKGPQNDPRHDIYLYGEL